MNRSRITGDLVSQNNIFVDIANDRVGIGSTIPGEKLSLPDSAKIALGNNADLQLYHDTSLSQIVSKDINNFTIRQQQGNGFLFIHGDQLHLRSQSTNEPYFVGTNNGTVQLYYDNSVKFNTAAIGIVVTGTTDTDHLTVSGVSTFSGQSNFNEDVYFLGASSKTITFDKSGGHIRHLDNAKSQFGTQGDLSIYHDGSNSYIEETGTGSLILKSNHLIGNVGAVQFMNASNTETIIYGAADGAVNLYNDGSKKFETTAYGIDVTGTASNDGSISSGISTTVKLKVNSTNALVDLTSGQSSFTRYGAINHYHNNATATAHNSIELRPRNGSTGRIIFLNMVGGTLTEKLRIDGNDGVQTSAHITPISDDTYALGGTSNRWSSVTSKVLHLIDTDAGSAAGPEFKLFRNSASPADADYLGQIKFAGESDTGVERNYAKITGKILDASNGTEDGIIEFAHIKAGSQVITGRWRSDSLQLLNSTNFSVAGTSEFTGDATFNGGAGAVSIAANSDIRLATGSWTGDAYGKIQQHANRLYLGAGSNADPCFVIRYSGTDRIYMTSGGTFYPVQDSNADLGKPSTRWANGYFDTLYGDGSNLTGITQTTINSNADNRIITGSGTANTLNAESTLTYNGSGVLEINDSGSSYTLRGAGVTKHEIAASASDNDLVIQNNKDQGNITSNIIFKGSGAGGETVKERLRIQANGLFGFGGVTPGGTPANKNVFLAIGDSDTGIVQDGDGQLEIFANAVEVVNFNAIDGYTSTKNVTTTGNVTGNNFNVGDTIFHDGDTNTKFRFPSNDNISIETAGTSRIRIDGNGNIGINCTPASSGTLYNTVDHFLVIGDNDTGIAQDGDGQFEIWANNTEIANFNTSGVTFTTGITAGSRSRINADLGINVTPITTGQFGARGSRIALGDSDTGIAQHGDGQLGLYANNTKMANINTNGIGVNIGDSTSVRARLQIDSGTGGNNVPSNKALLFGTDGTREIMFLSDNNGTDTDAIIGSWNTVYNHQNAKIVFTKPAGNVGLIEFHTQNGTGITERMRIRNDGHIGINSTSPDSLVTIDSDTTDEFGVKIRNDNVAGMIGCFGDGHTYERQFVINASRSDSGATGALRLAGQNHIRFCADLNGERMRLDNSGRLGINHVPSTSHEYLTVKPNGNNVLDIAYRLNSSTDIRHKHYSDDGTYRGGFNYTRYSNSTRYPNLHHDHYWTTNPSGTSTQVSMRLTREGYLLQQYVPAFGVAQTTNPNQIAAGVYVFNEVYFNNGSHYSSANGRFTAPKAGAYCFSFSLQLYGANAAHCRFQINGSDVFQNGTSGPVYEDGPDSHETISHTMVLNLSQGDYVHVARSGTTRGMQSSFCGHLIG